jgi:hypothetical protein
MSAGPLSLSCDDVGHVGHVVHFYGGDEELVDSVARYLLAALQNDGMGIVVATPAHVHAFEARIAAAGVDVAAARAGRALVVLDAAETVRSFLVDEHPEPRAFQAVIGSLIGRANPTGRPVRVYGEMVALLWEAGQVTAALELEEMWNELGRRMPFSLFCAYDLAMVGRESGIEGFREIGNRHSSVVGDQPGDDDAMRTFGLALDAPGAARHFVIGALHPDSADELLDDAALVVTELATNAVLHARSGFTVVVSQAPDRVRIAVRDASPVPPAGQPASAVACSGRGLAMVAAVASRWSCEPLGFGKVVWAELSR